ncbi:MAG TPA: DUF2330 domain-containing protein [Aggregatilineales bacterium]|nr:DUF2330 domain-containing protein [Aggregatilineales bacterium]
MRLRYGLSGLSFVIAVVIALSSAGSAVEACGGLFCQNIPVDQQGERIIFTMNGNGMISAYVQINYTGEAPDFSWVVPVPDVPEVDVAEMATFDEISQLTRPTYTPPEPPECSIVLFEMMEGDTAGAAPPGGAGVEVLASGTAGPYAYDVIASPDPNALITWLRTNEYRITEEMEPLVSVYIDEDMVFLAMKLQPDQGVQDIQPVVMTYASTRPMIPLRLTAVAANPNMTVATWIFADSQAFPFNYAHPVIDDSDIRFDFVTYNNNYQILLDQTIDLYDGRAFVTEYAQRTDVFMREFNPTDPLLVKLSTKYAYITRLIGRISPEEMTVDPIFDFSDSLRDVSNIHDLTDFDSEVVWGCKDEPAAVEYDSSVVPPGFE